MGSAWVWARACVCIDVCEFRPDSCGKIASEKISTLKRERGRRDVAEREMLNFYSKNWTCSTRGPPLLGFRASLWMPVVLATILETTLCISALAASPYAWANCLQPFWAHTLKSSFSHLFTVCSLLFFKPQWLVQWEADFNWSAGDILLHLMANTVRIWLWLKWRCPKCRYYF